jgi:hypothetical protein
MNLTYYKNSTIVPDALQIFCLTRDLQIQREKIAQSLGFKLLPTELYRAHVVTSMDVNEEEIFDLDSCRSRLWFSWALKIMNITPMTDLQQKVICKRYS